MNREEIKKNKKIIILIISFIVLLSINNIINNKINKKELNISSINERKSKILSIETLFIKEERLLKILSVYKKNLLFEKKENKYVISTKKDISKKDFISMINKLLNVSSNIDYIKIDKEKNYYQMEIKIWEY